MDQQSPEPPVAPTIPFWQQLRWRLIIAFVLLAVVPVILLETITNALNRDEVRAQVFNQLQSVADIKRDQITAWISDSTMSLGFLLSGPVSDRLITFTNTPTPTATEQAQIDDILSQALMPAGTNGGRSTRFRSLFL